MFPERVEFRLPALCLAVALALPGVAFSQNETDKPETSKSDAAAAPADQAPAKPVAAKPDATQDPLKRPLSEKERKANERRFKQEVSGSYKKWLDEDVRWIITDEERSAFKQLSNDEERDQFIEAFWQRRD